MEPMYTAFLMEFLYMAALAGLYLFVLPVLAMPVFVSTDGTFLEEYRESFLCTHWFSAWGAFIVGCISLMVWAVNCLQGAQ